MSAQLTLNFASIADLFAFLAARPGVEAAVTTPAPASAQPPVEKATKPGKSAPAAAPAAASAPTAAPTPAAAPEPSPASSTVAELPYAPLAERITKAIAASNPKAPDNRTALKALFGELTAEYGTPVKTGSDVKPADRPRLAAVLDSLAAAPEESMS